MECEVDSFTNKGKKFQSNLLHKRIDSYLNVLYGLERKVYKIHEKIDKDRKLRM